MGVLKHPEHAPGDGRIKTYTNKTGTRDNNGQDVSYS